MEFIEKRFVCDKDAIQTEELIGQDRCEYLNLVDSKRWQPASGKEKFQEQY